MVSKRTPLVFSPTSNFHFGIHYFFQKHDRPGWCALGSCYRESQLLACLPNVGRQPSVMANESSGPWRSMCRTTLFSMTLPKLGAGAHRLVFIESLEECQTKIFMHIFAAWRQFVSGFEAHSCHFDIKMLLVRSLRALEQHRILGRSCPWAFGKRLKTIPLKADWEPLFWVAPFMSCPTLESFWGTPDK